MSSIDATKGMVGGGFYDAHSSFQADVAASGAGLLDRGMAMLPLAEGASVLVADYGCAEGRNSMAIVRHALAGLSERGAKDLAVLHNDLPTNDWAAVAKNLAGPESYLGQFPRTRVLFAPRSFFERVTLPASVSVGTSGSAAHWLSRQPPDIDMPTSLYRSDAPPAELAKILRQAASDWEAFLAARAEELQPGGILLVQMLGADGTVAPARVSAAGLLKLMNACALQLVESGDIPEEVYARYCFPVVPRTIAEARAPIDGPLADSLELLDAGLTPVASPYDEALKATGDVTAYARSYTAFTRAFSESTLSEGLFAFAPSASTLADRFYDTMEATLAARPNDYPFDDLTLAILLRRRA